MNHRRWILPASLCLALLALHSGEPRAQTSSDSEFDAFIEAPKISEEKLHDLHFWMGEVEAEPDDVTVRLALANAYVLNKRIPESIPVYEKVVKDYPEYKIAWNNLGTAYRSLEKLGKSIRAYKKAIEIDPEYALAHYNLGVAYEEAKEFDKAIEHWGMAVEYDPKLLEVKHNPQVATNHRIYAVLIYNYLRADGLLAVPLERPYELRDEE